MQGKCGGGSDARISGARGFITVFSGQFVFKIIIIIGALLVVKIDGKVYKIGDSVVLEGKNFWIFY